MLFQYCGPAPNGIRSGLAVTHMKMTQCGGAGLGPEPEQTKKDRIRESWQLPVWVSAAVAVESEWRLAWAAALSGYGAGGRSAGRGQYSGAAGRPAAANSQAPAGYRPSAPS